MVCCARWRGSDLADLYGASRIPIYVLNVAYPLVPDEVKDFCAGKRAVLVVEEGSPEYVEQQINVILRGADIQTRVLGKGCLPRSGDYTSEVLLRGTCRVPCRRRVPPASTPTPSPRARDEMLAHKPRGHGGASAISRRGRRISAPAARSGRCSPPSSSCSARSARPISAPTSAAIRSRPSRRSRSAIRSSATACRSPAPPRSARTWRSGPIAIMGDGGFWHNGLITGVASNMFNKGDGVLDRDAERLRLRHRPAISAVEHGQPQRHADRHQHREDAALAGRQLAAHGAHLQRRQHGGDAERGDAHAPSAASR